MSIGPTFNHKLAKLDVATGHEAREPNDGSWEHADTQGTLRPEDFVPCTRCHLRGHVAGDPDRCLVLHVSGLGSSPWMAAGAGDE